MSREGLSLLKEFEGLRLTAVQLPDGRWSMGHGHTQYAREGTTITAGDAEALLIYDLIPVVAAVNDSVVPEISQSQFDALVCFAFNVGADAFRQSEVLQRVNQERMTEAALAMAIWRAGAFDGRRVVLDALVRRRSAEEALMLGTGGREVPSDLVRPEIDPQAQAALPSVPPARFEETIDGERAAAILAEPELSAVTETSETPDPTSDSAASFSEIDPGALLVEGPEASDSPAIPAQTDEGSEEAGSEPAAGGSADLAESAFSPRSYSSVPIAPFSPLNAARPGGEPTPQLPTESEDDTTGLMDAPAAGARIDEPPLVLILTPPPEVAAEPPVAAPEAASAAEVSAEFVTESADETPLFDQTGPTANAVEGEPVIYYEPQDEDDDRPSRWSETGAYAATGIVGLAAFGFGIAGFQLAGQEPIPPGSFDEKTAISWVLVAIGVVCVWIGAYNLFKRLGGPEDA
ncbi:MAG: lysozyme [Caulobacterales bacterium]|nr:lysozyme [Caulobacterales bacterium]